MEKSKNNGLSTAALVLGIIGLCTSFIPIINNLSFFMGILAVVFGLVSIAKKTKKSKCIAAIILGVLSVYFTIEMQNSFSESLDELNNNLSGGDTEEILQNYLDVELGEFQVTNNGYWNETKLLVKVKNKSNETKSFSIQLEALNPDGSRITNTYIYIDDLASGQSQTFEEFTYIDSDKLEIMKNATFKVVDVSMY